MTISRDVLIASRTPLLGDALLDLMETQGWNASVVDEPAALMAARTPATGLVIFCSSMGGPELARILAAGDQEIPFVVMIDGHERVDEAWPGASATLGLRASGAEILDVLRDLLPT